MTEKSEREQLQRENAALQRQVDELRAQAAEHKAGPPALNPPRHVPDYKISEGERNDLALQGVTRSAFTGEDLHADDFGVEVLTEDGRERLRKARERRHRQQQAETTQPIPGE